MSEPRETLVRSFSVGDVRQDRAYDRPSVTVKFLEPRKRKWNSTYIPPTNLGYLTIESGGCTVYDSRDDVPCDMDYFNAARDRLKGKGGLRT